VATAAAAAAAAGDVGHARRNPHPSLHYAATMATPNRQRRRNMIATVIVLLTPVVTSAASPPAAAADIGKFCQVILRQFLFSIFCFFNVELYIVCMQPVGGGMTTNS